MKAKDYDKAILTFRVAIQAEPARIDLRRELAYTLLKTGETEAALDVFGDIVKISPTDWHSNLERGYLSHECRQTREARRIFDRVRKTADAASKEAAEQAFQNIDQPLAEMIRRSFQSVNHNPGDYSAHIDLARAADQRDDPKLAAQHYQQAWELRPVDRQLLVDLGRMRRELDDIEGANGAWLAATRGAQPRAAEHAREFLPQRYPYASEFQKALALDRANIGLRRDLAFLYLAVNQSQNAETEFLRLLESEPEDPVSLAQVGLMRLARNERAAAMPMLEKVLKGKDTALADRIRDALKKIQSEPLPAPPPRKEEPPRSNKKMAEKSLEAGYLNDAVRYYHAAREDDPDDTEILLKLGFTYNLLRRDEDAIRYFDAARKSSNETVRVQAERAYRNLRPTASRVRTTTWLFPLFSSRWHEGFTYGQWKADVRLGKLPFRPYVTARLAADSQRSGGAVRPQYLSESSIIFGAGIATNTWRGMTAWAEAGSAVRYRNRKDIGRMIPDYRGGLSFTRGFGKRIHAESAGLFFETNADIVMLSRYQWNALFVSQNRAGYTLPAIGGIQWQAVWNMNATTDRLRQSWANFLDTGPGIRFRAKWMPPAMVWSLDLVRGAYTIGDAVRKPTYHDVRAGLWYAFTH